MRLYAIPIVKNRWAYYCHSTIPSVSRLTRAVEWSSKKWEQLDQAEADSWKKKLYTKGTNVMNQLDYQEWFLKSVPAKEDIEKPLNKVLVHYPPVLNGKLIESDLQKVLKERIPYHKKYMWYSAYWVPISCTFVIVPLIPNIPLAYNLFRLYSHYKAYKGAEHLQSISDYGSLFLTEDKQILNSSIVLKDDKDIDFPADIRKAIDTKDLKLGLLDKDIEGALNIKDIKDIVNTLNVPGLEMELNRARSQILKSIALENCK